jgi:hypothetical protein
LAGVYFCQVIISGFPFSCRYRSNQRSKQASGHDALLALFLLVVVQMEYAWAVAAVVGVADAPQIGIERPDIDQPHLADLDRPDGARAN